MWLGGCSSQKAVTVEPVPTASKAEVIIESQDPTEEDQLEYQRGIIAINAGNYAEAKRIFVRFVKNYPKLSGAYVNLGLIAIKHEDYDNAEWLSGLAIDLNPRQAYAYNLRAQLNLRKGKIKEARQDYLKAIKINPDYTNAHYNLALLYDIYLQELALAIEHYSKYLTLLGKEDEKTQEWINYLKNTLENG